MEKLVELLQEKLTATQQRSPAFSQRAMAKRLGISSGALSEILNGKRVITANTAGRIAKALNLSPAERKRIGLAREKRLREERPLDAQTFALIRDWWHFAILNLVHTKGFRGEPAWIADRLAIPLETARAAIKNLSDLGLIEPDERTGFRRSSAPLNTGDHLSEASIQQAHLADLALAERSLRQHSTAHRDFTSSTFTIALPGLARARKLIREFHDDIIDDAESEKGDEVYRMVVQLFPLSHVKN